MIWDIITLLGLSITTFGLWLIYPPLALIGVGAVLVYIAKRGYKRDS